MGKYGLISNKKKIPPQFGEPFRYAKSIHIYKHKICIRMRLMTTQQ